MKINLNYKIIKSVIVKSAPMFYLLLMSAISFANEHGAEAAEGHHAPDVFSLVIPFFNFSLFISLIYFALRKQIQDSFVEKHELVKATLERAAVKAREAKILLQQNEKKINDFHIEEDQINKRSEKDLKKFEQETLVAFEDKSEKFKIEQLNKINAHRTSLDKKAVEEITNEIMQDVRANLEENKGLREKAASALYSEFNV